MIPTIGRFDMFQRAFASAIAGNARFVTEIIIVDNSQDSGFHSLVMEVIDEYKEIVRLLAHRVRLSMAQSWTSAVEHVSNSWFILLHDDDELVLNDAIFLRLNDIDCMSVALIVFDYVVCNSERRYEVIRGCVSSEFIKQSFIRDCPPCVSTIINTAMAKRIGGWTDSCGYFLDLVFFIRILSLGMVVFNNHILGVCHEHESNFSVHSKRVAAFEPSIPALIEEMFFLLEKNNEKTELLLMLSRFVYGYDVVFNSRIYNFSMNLSKKISVICRYGCLLCAKIKRLLFLS